MTVGSGRYRQFERAAGVQDVLSLGLRRTIMTSAELKILTALSMPGALAEGEAPEGSRRVLPPRDRALARRPARPSVAAAIRRRWLDHRRRPRHGAAGCSSRPGRRAGASSGAAAPALAPRCRRSIAVCVAMIVGGLRHQPAWAGEVKAYPAEQARRLLPLPTCEEPTRRTIPTIALSTSWAWSRAPIAGSLEGPLVRVGRRW